MENLDANREAARDSLLWRAMSWSLGIAIGMVFLKMGAYFITGSAAILSDAAEAIVHVVAVLFVTYSLRLSSKPPDATHRYGHAKIGFFSRRSRRLAHSLSCLLHLFSLRQETHLS